MVNAGRALALASALVLTFCITCVTSGCVGISRESSPTAPSVALAIVTSTLPPALVGQSYQSQVTAQGGKPPYSWSITSGSPAGMSLTSAGLLSGVATQIGSFNFTLSASDVAGVTISKALTLAVADMCGVNSDGTTLHLPSNYGTLAMPAAGQANSMTDDQYGCATWKVADMSVHDAGPANIDSEDRWVLTKGATTGDPTNWFSKSGAFIRDLFTGEIVCTPGISGAGGWLWGAKTGDQDNLYFHVTDTSRIYKLNLPDCIADGGAAGPSSLSVSLYDDLKDPVTGAQLYPNLAWCQDASDFAVDGDHLCIGNDNGGYLQDPRRYTVSTKTVGPSLTGSPHQPPGCSPAPTKGNCYRGGFVGPTSNNIVVAYQPINGYQYLDLFDGNTGQYLLTLNNYNSHGALATWAGADYVVDDVNGLDPQRPPNCSPGFQAIKFDGTRTCLLDKYTVGPGGGPDYEEPHGNGIGTYGGNAYVAFDVIDYVYSYSAAYAFSNLPNPGSGTVLLSDALTTGNCSAGGGTKYALCAWNGTDKYWYPVSTASLPLRYDWATTWGVYYNEIYFLFLDGGTPRHMVHHRSFSVEPLLGGAGTSAYWSSPRVVVSRSGKYMAWDSTWGPNNNISVYVAKIK